MSLVRNARTKQLATLVNTVAAASIAAGVVAPPVALTYGVPGPFAGSLRALLASAAWLATGAGLHHALRLILMP